jgi:D-alanyl-D-alanine carboxypeptidase (penicillin-binding protein 5/6)
MKTVSKGSMVYCRHIYFWILILGLLTTSAGAASIPEAPQLPVRGYILMDFQSGQVLAEINGDERLEPASITKLMTAYILYQALQDDTVKLTDQVRISEKAWRMEGSRMFVEVDTTVSVEDLLMGMVVQSGNDATVALAEYVAGSEAAFAALMNQEANRLGLAESHFVNSTGLPDPDHYTTVKDIAILVRALIDEFPEQYERYAIKEYTFNSIKQYNRNRLLWQDETVDGVKTGHTQSAGFCLVASARRDDMRLISVVLGADTERDRFSASQALLNYGFRFFETHRLYAANRALSEVRVWKGVVNTLPLGLVEDLYVAIPRGSYEAMQASMTVNNTVLAPAKKGVPYGTVTVALDDKSITDRPLVALRDVEQAGFFGRMVDQMRLSVGSLFK